MQRQGRAPRRDATQNNRVVFERLWRGTFQAVLAGPARRARASSHEPTSDVALPSLAPRPAPPDALAPALRSILEGLRNSCCCRCNCNATDRNFNDNLQVCLSNDEERKSMRSVIRCAHYLINILLYVLHRRSYRQLYYKYGSPPSSDMNFHVSL